MGIEATSLRLNKVQDILSVCTMKYLLPIQLSIITIDVNHLHYELINFNLQ